MQINPTAISNLPDTLAMPVMVGFLLSLRDRQSKMDTRCWLIALSFISLSQVTWYVSSHPLLQLTVSLCGQLLAGFAFASFRSGLGEIEGFDFRYLTLNAIPLLGLEILYGAGCTSPSAYLLMLLLAATVLGISTAMRRRGAGRAWIMGAGFAFLAGLASVHAFEWLAYLNLAGVYAYAVVRFRTQLAAKSIGKVAIVTSLTLLGLGFAIHPWVLHVFPQFMPLFDQVSNMQKFFAAIGMLLVLVENQSARNQFLALHDQLTGIPNRRMLDAALKSEIEWAQKASGRVTLIMIDLDGFKKVNDTHGHLAGDHVLHEVARRLRAHLRATDLVARMGGDEFVVLSRSATTDEQIQGLQSTLRRWIREPMQWETQSLWVDGSFGVACYPDDLARWSQNLQLDSAERLSAALLRIADMRMYAQKPRSREPGAELEMLFPTGSLS